MPEVDAGAVEYTWSGAKVLFMDSENLLIEMPAVSTPDGRRIGAANVKVCKQYVTEEENISCNLRLEVRLEVSLNGGVDWATEPVDAPAIFAFLDEPQVVNLSQKWGNLRAGFDIIVQILHLRFRPSCTTPATMSGCALPEDIAYCRIGTTDSVLTHLDADHASCRVPPQAAEMVAPVALGTVDGQYFGSAGNHEADDIAHHTKFYYWDGRGIHRVVPAEGPVAGGQLVSLVGNFTGIPTNDPITVKFGEAPVADLVARSDTEVVVRLAALTLAQGEERRSVLPSITWDRTGLLFLNESAPYTQRVYPTLSSIKPAHGPATAGTMIEVRGAGLDQQGLCRLASADGEVMLLQALWVSSVLVLCEATAHEPGIFSFELGFGAGGYQTPSGLTFTYDVDPHIGSLAPAHVSLWAHTLLTPTPGGGHDVGVKIGVTGLNFLDTPDLAVRIAGQVQPATFVSPTYATFFAPFVREAGRYPAFLTTNGADFTQAASDISLTYHPDFTIERLSNYRVQVAHGSTVTLTAWGQGLPKAGDVLAFYCMFGQTSTAASETVAVRAGLIS